MRNDSKGRDIFYGVVAVATLIVAIIGATLAYFSITAQSNEGAVNATAAIVSIEYNDGQQVTAQADKLIPASFDVVQTVYEARIKPLTQDLASESNVCIDSNDRQVCSAYRFTVKSDLERGVTAFLNTEHNGFTYLSYAVYDVTNGQWLSLNDEGSTDLSLDSCSIENDIIDDDCYTKDGNKKRYSTSNPMAINSIFGYTLKDNVTQNQTQTIASATRAYDLVLFIKESGDNQNIDQGKNYRGTIMIEVLDGGISGNGQITGCVGDDCE